MMEDGGQWQATMDKSRKQRKTAEDDGKQRRMVGNGGERWEMGTTQFRPSWSLSVSYRANRGKDRTGQQNAIHPRL